MAARGNQFGKLASNHLRHAPAGGLPPQHEIGEAEFGDQRFDIADVILDEVGRLRMPVGVAVATQVGRDDAVAPRKVRREVVEVVRGAADAVQQ